MKTEIFNEVEPELNPILANESQSELYRIAKMVLAMSKRVPRVPRLEMQQMIVCAQSGDERVLNHLIEMNAGLVLSVLRRMPNLVTKRGAHLHYADFFQVGIEGLRESILRFDPSRNCAFSTCAVLWIRQRIQYAVRDIEREVRFPGATHELLPKIYAAEDKLQQTYGRPPTIAEIAATIGHKTHTIQKTLNADRLFLKCELHSNESQEIDLVTDTHATCPAAHIVLRSDLAAAMTTLNPKEHEVISRRFGLNQHHAHSFTECGQAMNLTNARVGQLSQSAFKKLRATMTKDETSNL